MEAHGVIFCGPLLFFSNPRFFVKMVNLLYLSCFYLFYVFWQRVANRKRCSEEPIMLKNLIIKTMRFGTYPHPHASSSSPQVRLLVTPLLQTPSRSTGSAGDLHKSLQVLTWFCCSQRVQQQRSSLLLQETRHRWETKQGTVVTGGVRLHGLQEII